jgi:hypothetical protein
VLILVYLLLISVPSAKNESLIMGPYNVSFDLNTTQPYLVNNSTKHSETYWGTKYDTYTIMLNSSRNFALITVVDFKYMKQSANDTQSGVEDFLQGLSYNHTINNRTIDDQSGILGIGVNSAGDFMYAAQYWPTFKASCNTNVLIVSNYPWDDGTLSLLKTIHVVFNQGGAPKFPSTNNQVWSAYDLTWQEVVALLSSSEAHNIAECNKMLTWENSMISNPDKSRHMDTRPCDAYEAIKRIPKNR